jgi:hypothetical protein
MPSSGLSLVGSGVAPFSHQRVTSMRQSCPGAGLQLLRSLPTPTRPSGRCARPAPRPGAASSRPAGFTANQVRTWDYWTAQHGFKSISIIQLSPAMFASNTITLNVEGKTYVVQGQPGRRYPSAPRVDNLTEEQVLRAGDKFPEPTGMSPGGVTWVTPSGNVMIYTDAGTASGPPPPRRGGARVRFGRGSTSSSARGGSRATTPSPNHRLGVPRRAASAPSLPGQVQR